MPRFATSVSPDVTRSQCDAQGEKEQVYEVDKILSHRWRAGTEEREYFVSWAGWPKSNNSWVSETSMGQCSLLPEYKRRQRIS